MVPRFSRSVNQICNFARTRMNLERTKYNDVNVFTCRWYSKVAAVGVMDSANYKGTTGSEVNLNKMFRSKPYSLALPVDSPLRVEPPKYEGMWHIFAKLTLLYSKQSMSIRAANVIYRRLVYQVDRPAIYNVYNLEKNFRTTFALLVMHMWFCYRRIREEKEEDAWDMAQYLFEIYNHDVELRLSKMGINLLLSKWMKDLEKIYLGNIDSYDRALLPEAERDQLEQVIWRNVFADDQTSFEDAQNEVQAMARYARREIKCLSLTDKEAFFSGNFLFTPLKNPVPSQ